MLPIFANGAATAAFSAIASEVGAAANSGDDDSIVLGAKKGGDGKLRNMRIGRKLLTQDENGNLVLEGDVGYDASEKGKAEKYVKGINGEHVAKDGDKQIKLTVRLTLTENGAGGDIRIVSFDTLAERTLASGGNLRKHKKSLWNPSKDKGPCILACAAVGANIIYFRWYPESHGMHETFHLMGFIEHSHSGIMQDGGKPSDLRYQDLDDLRGIYF